MAKITIFHPLDCNTPGEPYQVQTRHDAEYYIKKGFLSERPSDVDVEEAETQRNQNEWEKIQLETEAYLASLQEETVEEVKPTPKPKAKAKPAPKKVVPVKKVTS